MIAVFFVVLGIPTLLTVINTATLAQMFDQRAAEKVSLDKVPSPPWPDRDEVGMVIQTKR